MKMFPSMPKGEIVGNFSYQKENQRILVIDGKNVWSQ